MNQFFVIYSRNQSGEIDLRQFGSLAAEAALRQVETLYANELARAGLSIEQMAEWADSYRLGLADLQRFAAQPQPAGAVRQFQAYLPAELVEHPADLCYQLLSANPEPLALARVALREAVACGAVAYASLPAHLESIELVANNPHTMQLEWAKAFAANYAALPPRVQTPLEYHDLWVAAQQCWTLRWRNWLPTTARMYRQMLEAVPPLHQSKGRFALGEPWRHEGGRAVYAVFAADEGRFWVRYEFLDSEQPLLDPSAP